MKTAASSLLVGFLFALGLGLAGMTLPEKVIGFLDIFGKWDPSLMFVMVGALFVHAILYRLIMKRSSPLFASKFHVPSRTDIDKRLLGGAALFGTGWGLAGYCPAPAITALATFSASVIAFVISMLLGMALYSWWEKRTTAAKIAQ